MTTSASARSLQLPDAEIAYDVREPSAPSEHAPLLMVGQPMAAEGFGALAACVDERTVVTYDPRGLGRSTRSDGSDLHDPEVQAEDLHALIAELGGGPVDMFASSGGAVTALALVAKYPDDLRVLIAHEPPLIELLPDAEFARAASAAVDEAYAAGGFGAGMARFIGLVSWQGPFTEEYLAQPAADPAIFGLPTEDDGSRDDPLMGGASAPVTAFQPDIAALQAAPTRIVVGAGTDSRQVMPARAGAELADLLGSDLVMFRGGHGGFLADEWGQPGDPAAFAQQLRDALDA